MKWMLDTNICIALIKRRQAHLIASLERHPIGEVGISSITLAELEFGVSKSAHRERNEAALAAFVAPLELALFDVVAARAYGEVRSNLEKRGEPIGSLDTLIAGHALSVGAVLVTNNTREFRKVTGLKVEDWTKT
jgi:tRNA(fMet)-specific endonuclease VapC